MKKIFLAAAAFTFSLLAFAGTGAPSDVNKKVLDAFNNTFKQVADVGWHEYTNYYEVSFKQADIYTRVMYDKEGNILESYRYYTEDGLPLLIRSNLKKKYSDKKVFGVTEVATQTATEYHIVLEDGQNWIMVKADNYGNLDQQKKYKKA